MCPSLTFEMVATCDLKASPLNARTHSRSQIQQIVASIKNFGFTNPVLIDGSNELIAGHGRLEAATSLGLDAVPAIRITHLSNAEKRALRLADNKIATNAGWDMNLLSAELADLSSLELSFDLEVTGFAVPEIDIILGDGDQFRSDQPEEVEVPDEDLASVTQAGDCWRLGPHRVLCGNALVPEDYSELMQGDVADVGFTDPPYNVRINGHVSGKGRVRHPEFLQASGELNEEEFSRFLSDALRLSADHSRSGAIWFACMDWRHMGEMLEAGQQNIGTLLNLCVWAKTNGGMGSLYRSQHELVFVFRKGREQHRNNVRLGRYGRNRTNVWTYPGVNTFRKGRLDELRAHPTAKPVDMVKDALLDVSKRGDLVLDPFLGAGATLIAAERCGRIARGIELDPAYVDVVLRRWREETSQDPERVCDGRTFSSLEEEAVR